MEEAAPSNRSTRLLSTRLPELTVFDVARRVGYVSEEAFSRAFKRERGLSPAHWRAAHTTHKSAS